MPHFIETQALAKLDLPRKAEYLKVEEARNFLELFLRIENDCSHCFLLESLDLGNPHSRYDVIGFAPEGLLWAGPESLFWQEGNKAPLLLRTSNPYECLKEWMPQNIISRDYAGVWWVIYLTMPVIFLSPP